MKRFPFLDWMRGLAVLIMIQCHVFNSFAVQSVRDGGPYVLSQFVGGMAAPLFLIWLVTLLFYDRLTYVTFRPGQVTIHQAFGAGAKSYEAMGLTLEKKRDDLFRHWLLGAGSGDLGIRTGGASPQTYELANVLFVGSKLARAQRLLRERQVVKG